MSDICELGSIFSTVCMVEGLHFEAESFVLFVREIWMCAERLQLFEGRLANVYSEIQ